MRIWLYGGMLLAACSVVFALDNTPENRLQQAERYLSANPPQGMFQSIADTIAVTLPAAERQPYTDMLTKHIDLQAVSNTMKSAMVKHFTADELSVLADFYSRAEAKSAMSKMNAYMTDVIPVVQTEMFKAQVKAFDSPSKLNNQAGIAGE